MHLDNNWHSITAPAVAQALVKRLGEAFSADFDTLSLTRKDTIPLFEASRSTANLSLADAVAGAKLLRDIVQCPVHFLWLQPRAVAFLVYHPCLSPEAYTNAQLRDAGVPLAQWLPTALKDGIVLGPTSASAKPSKPAA